MRTFSRNISISSCYISSGGNGDSGGNIRTTSSGGSSRTTTSSSGGSGSSSGSIISSSGGTSSNSSSRSRSECPALGSCMYVCIYMYICVILHRTRVSVTSSRFDFSALSTSISRLLISISYRTYTYIHKYYNG